MQVLLRLYDPMDMDLIYLKLRYRKRFPGMIRGCLRAHLKEDFSPCISFSGDPSVFAKHPSHPLYVNLNLKPDDDKDIIEYLDGIRDFAKSDVIKTIIRSFYIEFPSVLFRPPYIGGGDVSASSTARNSFKKPVSKKDKDTSVKKIQAAESKETESKEPKPDAYKPAVVEETVLETEKANNQDNRIESISQPDQLSQTSQASQERSGAEKHFEPDNQAHQKEPVSAQEEVFEEADPFDMLANMMNR